MLIQQLISDLQSMGAIVVTDNPAMPDEQFTPFLQRELATCEWFLLVQTQEITRSSRVQEAMDMALQQVKQGRLRGVLRIICPSWDVWDEPVQWSGTKSYLFQGDYPRLRDKILLDLDLLQIEDEVEKSIRDAVTVMLPHERETTGQQHASIKKERSPFFLNRREQLRKLLTSFARSSLPARDQRKSIVPPPQQKVAHGDRPAAPPRPPIHAGRLIRYGIIGGCVLAVLLLISLPLLTRRPSSSGHGPAPSPTAPVSISASPTASPTAQTLVQDTFQRPNQTFWGAASDGQEWEGDANTLTAFSIADNTGQIAAHAAGTYSAVIGPAVGYADVTLSATVNRFAGSINLVNLGVVLRWQDTNNWYKALIDGNNLSIDRHVKGKATVTSVPFPAQDGRAYTLRFRAVGTALMAKAWPSDEAEPAGWMVTATDVSFASGQGGVRVVLQNTTRINVMSFKEIPA